MIAAPPGHEAELAALAPAGLEVEAVAGGATRAESVALALRAVATELVAVHDAARPLLDPALVAALVAALDARPDAAGAIAATPVADTIKRAADDGRTIAATEPREGLWAAQTPQLFRTEVLRRAHAEPGAGTATDDAMVVEATGGRVLLEPAPAENLKVTTPADLRLAEAVLLERS